MRATTPVWAVLALAGVLVWAQDPQARLPQEEAEDYFRKWLEEDILYIITDEERAVFLNLTTVEEKERFIEQFWYRRDPDPETAANEFREEHYRRLAYANDHYSVGVPGWKSDRGRVYIINGPPDSIEEHGQGEQYYRPLSEGGGVTTTYAWQVWYYRNIEGVGENLEIEFVDRTMTGHYVLARDESEKDAMLWVPGLGLTEAERLGLDGGKAERIGTRSMANMATRRGGNPLKMFAQNEDLFERLRRYTMLQAAPEIKFKDLESLVDIQLYYHELPFSVRQDLIQVTPTDFLAPITFFFKTGEFTFREKGGVRTATLNLYGRVETLNKRKVYSFDDNVNLTLNDSRPQGPPLSVFQRSIPLKPGRYKLTAIVKDVHGNKIGTLTRGIHVPSATTEKLNLSGIILADRVQPAKFEEFINDPFVLGTVKVYPSSQNRFQKGDPLGFYFEIYNVMVDQQTLDADLSLDLKISRGEQEIPLPFKDLHRLLHRYSDRFFAGSMLSTAALEPGRYRLTVEVTDNVAGTRAVETVQFEVTA